MAETIAEETVQETPETATETVEQNPEPATGEEVESEVAESGETATAETETQGEETDDNWLPQEQTKEFPLEVLAEYAVKRKLGWTDEQIAGDPGLQKLIKSQINADFRIQELRRQVEGEPEEVDDGQPLQLSDESDEALEQTQEVQPQTALTPDAQKQAYYQRIDQLVSQTVDPKALEAFGSDLLGLFGVNTDTAKLQQTLANPNLTPAQRADTQAMLTLAQSSGKVGAHLARNVVDLVSTIAPRMLSEWIEQLYPGTQQRYETGLAADGWQRLSDAVGQDKKPIYPNLPKFGTNDYRQLVLKAEKQLGLPQGGLGAMVLRDGNGNQLPIQQQYYAKLRMVAKVSSGQRLTPAIVQQAVQTGRKQEQQTAQRRASGRALGAGSPTSSSGRPTGNEDIFGPGLAEYKRRGG